jgi:hypothetical protein
MGSPALLMKEELVGLPLQINKTPPNLHVALGEVAGDGEMLNCIAKN